MMTVRIKKGGWEISGDSIKDLQLGIVAVQGALSGDSEPVKRRIGRPRKRPAQEANPGALSGDSEPVKRRIGRPRKRPAQEQVALVDPGNGTN